MKLALVAAMTLMAALAAPQWTAAGLLGNYRTSIGFESWGIELRKDSTANCRHSPDHSGGRTFDGIWSFDGEILTLRFTSTKGRLSTGDVWKFIPFKYGNQRYLAYVEDCRDSAALAAPQWTAAGLVGNYRTSTGFEIWGLELRKDATASYRYSPDHPGGRTFDGTWSFDGEIMTLRLTSIQGKRKTGHVWKFVPVAWGERQYLVYEAEIRDFAGRALRWKDSNLDPRSQDSEMHRAPLMRFADRNYKRRYGNPKAPGKYASWFDWR